MDWKRVLKEREAKCSRADHAHLKRQALLLGDTNLCDADCQELNESVRAMEFTQLHMQNTDELTCDGLPYLMPALSSVERSRIVQRELSVLDFSGCTGLDGRAFEFLLGNLDQLPMLKQLHLAYCAIESFQFNEDQKIASQLVELSLRGNPFLPEIFEGALPNMFRALKRLRYVTMHTSEEFDQEVSRVVVDCNRDRYHPIKLLDIASSHNREYNAIAHRRIESGSHLSRTSAVGLPGSGVNPHVYKASDKAQTIRDVRSICSKYLGMKQVAFLPDVEFKGEIASGSFGKVYKVERHAKTYAAKEMRGGKLQQEVLITEACKALLVTSDHIVRVEGFCWREVSNGFHLCMLCELVGDGKSTLETWSQDHKEDASREAMLLRIRFALNAAHALEALFLSNVFHGDFRACNMFVDETNALLKVGDFGQAIALDDASVVFSDGKHPWRYVPWEVLLTQECSTAADVYSFGISLWQLFNGGKKPFAQCENVTALREALRNAKNEYRLPPLGSRRPPQVVHAPRAVQQLINDCIAWDPLKRPSAQKIITTLLEVAADLEK